MIPRNAHGFTLLELLIGLAIAAIVMLPLSDMLRAGADSARAVRAGLDQNADARFAINRIAEHVTRVAPPPPPGPAGTANPAAWLEKLPYALVNGVLVETDPANSVLATGVRSFELSLPDAGAAQPTLRIDLVFNRAGCDTGDGQDCSVAHRRTVRLGALP